MKKITLFIVLLFCSSFVSYAQDENNAAPNSKQTTFEKFTSTIGHIVKFKDYKMDNVTGKVGSGLLAVNYIVHAEVREVIINNYCCPIKIGID